MVRVLRIKVLPSVGGCVTEHRECNTSEPYRACVVPSQWCARKNDTITLLFYSWRNIREILKKLYPLVLVVVKKMHRVL